MRGDLEARAACLAVLETPRQSRAEVAASSDIAAVSFGSLSKAAKEPLSHTFDEANMTW